MTDMLKEMAALVTGTDRSFRQELIRVLSAHGATVVDGWRRKEADGPLMDIDILIDVTEEGGPKAFTWFTDNDWRAVFEDAVVPVVRAARQVVPGMLLRDRGCVIFIARQKTTASPWEVIHNDMADAARLSIARSLAGMTRGTAVKVGAVVAGDQVRDHGGLMRVAVVDASASDEDVVSQVVELIRTLLLP